MILQALRKMAESELLNAKTTNVRISCSFSSYTYSRLPSHMVGHGYRHTWWAMATVTHGGPCSRTQLRGAPAQTIYLPPNHRRRLLGSNECKCTQRK